jgi:hypothetical protein
MLCRVKDFRRVINSLIIELLLFRKSPLAPAAEADKRGELFLHLEKGG